MIWLHLSLTLILILSLLISKKPEIWISGVWGKKKTLQIKNYVNNLNELHKHEPTSNFPHHQYSLKQLQVIFI